MLLFLLLHELDHLLLADGARVLFAFELSPSEDVVAQVALDRHVLTGSLIMVYELIARLKQLLALEAGACTRAFTLHMLKET